MGILWVILSWGAIIFIWSLQAKAEQQRRAEAVQARQREITNLLLDSMAKMLAMISKADGRISKGEVETASRCLKSLGLTEEEYRRCVTAFNSVDSASDAALRRCAREFAAVATVEARVLVYEMLWVVTAADGVLASGESRLLVAAADALGIDPSYYAYFRNRYFSADSEGAVNAGGHDDGLRKAYAKLGCTPSSTDEEVRSAYRKLAMRYHPDRLKADGVPDGMIAMANRSMAEINAAWETIKRERSRR
ncbi:MAG: TerB family tellurite resistance protein [Kiritimatiellae bacterium]|nr:TerB family tellurite resistance protein [Kiritimatiellia bacterium]